MHPDASATARRRRLAAAGLLLATGLVAVAVRAVGPTLDRLAWAASIDPTAQGIGQVVRQQKNSDCGPAALKMVLDHYGITGATLAELEVATGTGPDGTSMLALKRAAEARGLNGQGLRLSVERLDDIPLPAIAHVHGDHFVVIRSAGEELVIDDPSLGRLRMNSRTFERSWDGVLLTFTTSAPTIPRTVRMPSAPQATSNSTKGEQPSTTHHEVAHPAATHPGRPTPRRPASALR